MTYLGIREGKVYHEDRHETANYEDEIVSPADVPETLLAITTT